MEFKLEKNNFYINGTFLNKNVLDIIKNGKGIVRKNITESINYAIIGSEPDKIKLKNLEERNIRIIKENEFFDLLDLNYKENILFKVKEA
jgi:NAD-dependent DNA ligase